VRVLLTAAALFIGAGLAITVQQFLKDVRHAGGLRALHAELVAEAKQAKTTPPRAELPAAAVSLPKAQPWYLEKQHPRVWEPINRAETAEQPPWGAATRLDGTPLWQERSMP
jgi:hypothetical protein